MMMMSMETNFLTSNPFMKTMFKLARPTLAAKNNPLLYPHYDFKKLQDAAGTISISSPSTTITCCNLQSSSVEDNNGPPVHHTDWRSFRAKLVFTNEPATSRPKESSSSNRWNPNPKKDHNPRVMKAEKWAHVIHEPEKGCLLVATKKLDGVHIFERTVILLLSIDSDGPTGIILNRPSSLKEEARSTAADVEDIFVDRPLFFGGTLNGKLVLVSPKKADAEEVVKRSGVFEEVMDGLYYGTKEESVGCAAEMVKRNEVEFEDFRVFEGYCWWGNNKLKEEIRDGYWKVIACSPSIFKLD